MRKLAILLAFLTASLTAAAQQPDSITAITNVKVWDGHADKAVENCTVVVRGNLVSEVGPDVKVPAGAMVIDGKGGTLIPGLSDAHLHLMFNAPMNRMYNDYHWAYAAARAVKMAENFLMLGFTTIRDMGGPVFGIKNAIDEGLFPGPRIYPSGALVSQTSGHGDMRNPNEMDRHIRSNVGAPYELLGWSYLVDGVPSVLNGVRDNLRHGSSQIKMMAGGGIATRYDPLESLQFTEEELRAGVKAATDWGTYVGVHVYTAEGIERALRAGAKTIEHGQLADEKAIKMIADSGAWLVPQSYWTMMDANTYSNHPAKFRQAQEGAVREMELAKKYNVKLGYGTDTFGELGIEPQALLEFKSRARWYTPVEILRQATSNNAEIFAMSGLVNPYTEGKLGVIEPGAYADLLVYNENPLEDILVVTRPEETLVLLMKDGKLYKNLLTPGWKPYVSVPKPTAVRQWNNP